MTDLRERLQAALGPQFVLGDELGGGGMSRVFLAGEVALARKVVVKVLPPELSYGVSEERFHREVQLAAGLQHPHIVPLLAAGQAGELFWYTMPYIEGESLRARLVRDRELPVGEVVRILRDVADALDFAHTRGIVHRDIKPDNVLISGHHAVVTDFGVAKAISAASGAASLTSIGVALGTPAYMAPEQASADPHVDHRADIYSLGALAYEMLTGRPPFEGAPQVVLAAHVTQTPASVSERRPAVPPPLASLVMRCLEKKAADRWQTAAELHAVLEGMATPSGGMTPTSALPVSRAPRRPRLLWVGVAAGVLAVAVAGYALLSHRPAVAAPASSITILPFAPASQDTMLERLGRDLVITLSAGLDAVGEIRTAYPQAVLAGTRARGMSVEEGAQLARRLGTRSFVLGSLVRTGAAVRVDFALHDARDLSPLARGSVAGPPEDVSALSDSVAWALLRLLWRTGAAPTPQVSAVTTRSLPALRAFLEGEQLVERSNWPAAALAYQRAFEADSTFWLAYWRYSYARGWNFQPVAPAIRRAYREHVDALPERERADLKGQMLPRATERLESARRLVAQYPDYLPGWLSYADGIFHSWAGLGPTMADAQAGFKTLVALDPGFTPGWEHLAWTSVYLLDTTTAIRALEMLDHLPYTPEVPSGSLDVRVWNRLLLDLARKGEAEPGRLDTLADQFVDPAIAPGWGALNIRMAWIGREAMGLLARMRRRGIPPVAEQAVMRREAEAWASRGAWDSALAAADREAVRFAGRTSYAGSPAAVSAYRTAVLAAWLQVGPAALAERRRAAALALLASDTSGADSAEVFWLDGLTAFSGKDARALDQARTRLRGVSGGSAGPLLGMLGALTLGLADRTRVAADSLASLVTTVQDTSELDWTPWHPYFHWVGRLTAAPLLRERGDNPRARQLLDAFDRVWASPEAWSASWALLSVAQREKGVAAAAMGDSVAARRAARWLLILYDMPPPPHRAWLDEARALLGRQAN